jgi:uncharacterized protein
MLVFCVATKRKYPERRRFPGYTKTRRLGFVGPVKMRENIRQDRRMNKDEVINKLRAHEPELKAAGIVRLAVFGSVARGDNSPESDVDLLADFDKTKRYTLLTMGRLENRLADLLGTRVDLSSPEWLKESVKNRVLEEAVLAF